MSDAAKKRTFIYGAGRMGREVLAHCRAQGIEPQSPSSIARRDAPHGGFLAGHFDIDVFEADRTNERTNGPPRASQSRRRRRRTRTTVSHVRAFDDVRTLWTEMSRDRLAARHAVLARAALRLLLERGVDRARARALLGDYGEPSMCSIGSLRCARTGALRTTRNAHRRTTSTCRLVSRLAQPMHLLDCGAYDGDTVRLLRQHDYTIERFDRTRTRPRHFARLVAALSATRRGGSSNGRSRLPRTASSHSSAGEGGAAHVDAARERDDRRRTDRRPLRRLSAHADQDGYRRRRAGCARRRSDDDRAPPPRPRDQRVSPRRRPLEPAAEYPCARA